MYDFFLNELEIAYETEWKSCKRTDQLSRDWWQQHPHQNCLWPLPPPTVNKRNALMNTSNRKYIHYNKKSTCVKTCFQINKMLSSIVACTFSKEVVCIGAGFWVNEETGWGPEELPGLSVLCSASVKRKEKKTVVNNRVKPTIFSNHI